MHVHMCAPVFALSFIVDNNMYVEDYTRRKSHDIAVEVIFWGP